MAVTIPARPIGAGARSPARVSSRSRERVVVGWSALSLTMLSIVILLTVVGLVFVASASSVTSLHRYGTSWHYFRRQVQWVVIGMAAMVITTLLPYRIWQRLAPWIFGVGIVGTLVTLSPLGVTKNGASRWIGSASLQLQPTEFLKFGVLLALAGLFVFRADRIDDTRQTLRPGILVVVPSLVLVMLQPDMGTAIMIFVIAASLFGVSGMSKERLAKLGVGAAVVTLLIAWIEPYRRDRMLAFLHPTLDVSGIGYHVFQSKLGFASGRLFGVGVGASRAKWGFLPNSFTDFIYAIIGEELGLVGAVTVLLLFLSIAILGLRVARRAPDRFGMLLATGVTSWIVGQAVINIGAVIGAMPVTGIPLPFISAGGSSFVVVTAAAGVLINVARHGRRPVRPEGSRAERRTQPA